MPSSKPASCPRVVALSLPCCLRRHGVQKPLQQGALRYFLNSRMARRLHPALCAACPPRQQFKRWHATSLPELPPCSATSGWWTTAAAAAAAHTAAPAPAPAAGEPQQCSAQHPRVDTQRLAQLPVLANRPDMSALNCQQSALFLSGSTGMSGWVCLC